MRFMHNRVLNRHIFAGENAVYWCGVMADLTGYFPTKEQLRNIYLMGIRRSIRRDLQKIYIDMWE